MKKSYWAGLIFLTGLFGLALLSYFFGVAGAAISYPLPALIAGAFGIGILVQSIRLTRASGSARPFIVFGAIALFISTIFLATKDTQTSAEVIGHLAASFLTFLVMWYFFTIYQIRLAIDEVHLLSITILAWIFFYNTHSWWWYSTILATIVAVCALLLRNKIDAPIRLGLFVWFTAINAFLVVSQFHEQYSVIFSLMSQTSNHIPLSFISEMFAAGLAAPVALFPLFHAFLVIPLAVLVVFGGHIQRRVQELKKHVVSITRSVQNDSFRDWRALAVIGGVAACSALAILGIIEKTLAMNIGYTLIGLWISVRPESLEEADL